MSEAAPEAPAAPEAIELPSSPDAAFQTLMDVLAPEPPDEAAATGTTPAGAAAPANGQPAAPAQADGGAGAAASAGAAGDGGKPAVPGDGTAGAPAAGGDAAASGDAAAGGDAAAPAAADAVARGDLPADWTAAAADVAPKFGELSNSIETKVLEGFQATALDAVRKDYKPYFDAVEQHPRALVGKQVPRADGAEGFETLRDSADAKEWQEAIKLLLTAEVNARARRELDANGDFLNTMHASVELFQNNLDLIPQTKEFDKVLADRLTNLLEPYEVRVDGKLNGYSIPVQPIINQLRAQIASERAAAQAAAPGTPAAPSPAAGVPAAPATGGTPAAPPAAAEPPQAGITSKAGSGEQTEDFSALFGTLGLPGLRI